MKGEKIKAEHLNLCRSDIENMIEQWIFDEKDRAMLKRRLLDGITYERLAEEFDLSTAQAKRRIYKAQERFFKHF